jgi:hypothetical protein
MGNGDGADPRPGADSRPGENEPVPFMQRVCDNHFLLLFLGVTIPTVLYIVWGIMELVGIPVAP